MKRNKLLFPDTNHFQTKLSVHMAYINYAGHIGSDGFLALVHELRVRLLRHYGFSEGDVAGTALIMSEAALQFQGEAYPGDVLNCDIAISDITRTTFGVYYRIRHPERGAVLTARTTMGTISREKKKMVAVPMAFLQALGEA